MYLILCALHIDVKKYKREVKFVGKSLRYERKILTFASRNKNNNNLNHTDMKKMVIALFSLLMSVSANAFEFDGIDLNASVGEITRMVSSKGYVFDEATNSLKGNCHGKEIRLSFDYVNVTKPSRLGQLIVDVPETEANALDIIVTTFNIIYHQVSAEGGVFSYVVDKDGTVLNVSKTADGIRLAYDTPYHKK